jgi:hypothetical protein
MSNRKMNNLGKTIVFSAFLFGSLALVFGMWIMEFVSHEPSSPSYVRATFAVPTAEGFEMTLEAMPTREHQPGYSGGQGQGEHDESADPSPSPTFDVADWVPEEGLSDDLADE